MNLYTFRSNHPQKEPVQVEATDEQEARNLAFDEFWPRRSVSQWRGAGLRLIDARITFPGNTITTPRGAFPR